MYDTMRKFLSFVFLSVALLNGGSMTTANAQVPDAVWSPMFDEIRMASGT